MANYTRVPAGMAYRAALIRSRQYSKKTETWYERTGYDCALRSPLFDGTDYGDWLRNIYETSLDALRGDYDFAEYANGWGPERIKLQPTACLKSTGQADLIFVQLGHKYLIHNTSSALEQIEQAGEFPLEPGLALIAITRLAKRQRIFAPFSVECPGALYSAGADGRFSDVPRWEVRPPTEFARGFIGLDWNWTRRARHLQGAGSGKYMPTK